MEMKKKLNQITYAMLKKKLFDRSSLILEYVSFPAKYAIL